jgi:hypothetical protein
MLVLQHPQHDCPHHLQQAAAHMLYCIACELSEQQAEVLQQLGEHLEWLLSNVCSDRFPQLSGAAAAAVAHAEKQLQLQQILQALLQPSYTCGEAPDTAAAGTATGAVAAAAAAVARVKQLLQRGHTRALLCHLAAQQLPSLLQAAASDLDVAVAVFEITYQANNTAALRRAMREHAGEVLAAVHQAALHLRDSNEMSHLQLGHDKLGMLLAAVVTVRELLSDTPGSNFDSLLSQQLHLTAAVDCHLALVECSAFDFPGAALMWSYSMHWLVHQDTVMQQMPATPPAAAAGGSAATCDSLLGASTEAAAAAVSGAAAVLAQPQRMQRLAAQPQRMQRLAALAEQVLVPSNTPSTWSSALGNSSRPNRSDLLQLLKQVAAAAAVAGRAVPWLQLLVTTLQDEVQILQQLQQQVSLTGPASGSKPAAATAADSAAVQNALHALSASLLELLDCLRPVCSCRQGLLAVSQHVQVLLLCADQMLTMRWWQQEVMPNGGSLDKGLADWETELSRWEAGQQWAEKTAAAAAAELQQTQQQHVQARLDLQSAIISMAKVHAQLSAAEAQRQQQQDHQQQQQHAAVLSEVVTAVDETAAASRRLAELEELLQLA